jgi:hypothetical protein
MLPILLSHRCGRYAACNAKQGVRCCGEGCLRGYRRPSVRGCIDSYRRETRRVRLAPSPGELARGRPRGLGSARELHRRWDPVLLRSTRPCAEPQADGRTVGGSGSGRWRRRRPNRLRAVHHRSGRWVPTVRRCSGFRRHSTGRPADCWGGAPQSVRNPDLRGHTCGGPGLRRIGGPERGVLLGCLFSRISCRHGRSVCPVRRGVRRCASPCWTRRCLPAHLDREWVRMAKLTLASRFDLARSRLNPRLADVLTPAMAATGGSRRASAPHLPCAGNAQRTGEHADCASGVHEPVTGAPALASAPAIRRLFRRWRWPLRGRSSAAATDVRAPAPVP